MKKWVILILLTSISAELFSAVSELEDLLETESMIIMIMESYVARAQERIDMIKRGLSEYSSQHNMALKDIDSFISHPIDAYLFIKRVATDWKKFELVILFDDIIEDVLAGLKDIQTTMSYPEPGDVAGATAGLLRLQDMYNLSPASLVKGEIYGVKSSRRLTVEDCFELGLYAFSERKYHQMKLWMNEVVSLLGSRLNFNGVTKCEALENLAYSHYMEGNIKKALMFTEQLLEIFPNHPRALQNKAYYVQVINSKRLIDDPLTETLATSPTEDDLYKMVCNDEVSPLLSMSSSLKCRYLNNNPFLRIAPLRQEDAYISPKILLFKNIVSEDEIDSLKSLTKKRLTRAPFENPAGGPDFSQEIRLSKFSWLIPGNILADRILKRVEDMTALSTDSAEILQVVNYGIGGHYIVHEDYAKLETSKITTMGTGNRIATVLIYLSDVRHGGATVFPSLQLSIRPEKGMALFWFNLLPDGQGDSRTRHAACPVLIGSKWVATIWLHEKGQEFRRPCDMLPNTPIS